MRGEVYRLPARGKGHQQKGRRYAVVLQPDWLTLSTWIVACTTYTRVIGFEQRGCGPLHASDPTTSLTVNGASWGTTLALAYAHAHPDRVTALVLVLVTTTSRPEVDWITESVGAIPAVLIHGRRDISSPVATAWQLHQHWPASQLVIDETGGHGGGSMTATWRTANDRLLGT